jgi:predicted MFS family arabinose efflux permease
LLSLYGWRSSFYLVSVVALAMALGWLSAPSLREQFGRLPQAVGGYGSLLRNSTFLRYALSQACNLGGLLAIVFSAPKIIASSMGGSLADFVTMQVMGITLYVIAANTTGVFARWWGDENTILYGSVLSAAGSLGLIGVALVADTSIPLLWACFLMINLGLGIRGPVGFYKALVAAGSNDARGAALMILFVMLVAAGGTAAVATVIEQGLLPLSLVASAILWASVALLLALPASAPGSSAGR